MKEIDDTWDLSKNYLKAIYTCIRKNRLARGNFDDRFRKTKRGMQVFKFLIAYKGQEELIDKDVIMDYFKRYLT